MKLTILEDDYSFYLVATQEDITPVLDEYGTLAGIPWGSFYSVREIDKESQRMSTRTAYIPGQDNEELGRQAARLIDEKTRFYI